MGVDGWSGDLDTWDAIPVRDRRVLVVCDSDVQVNKHVRHAATRLAAFLKQTGARVEFIVFPEGQEGSKIGLDDFFANGNTVDAPFALAN